MKLKRMLCLALCLALLLPAVSALAAEETGGAALRRDHVAYLQGSGGLFRPGDSLTRAETCAILYKLLEDRSMGPETSSFSDVAEGAWYAGVVAVLASRGLVTGQNGRFRPEEPMTRGELAELLLRVSPAPGGADCAFWDVAEEDPIYPAVAAAVGQGWFKGYDDGGFHPGDALTRAQAAAVFNRVLGRAADPQVLKAGDARRFTDVSAQDWFYADVTEASVAHEAEKAGDGERWTGYQKTYLLSFHFPGTTRKVLADEGTLPSGVPGHGPEGQKVLRYVTASGAEADPAGTRVTASADYYAVYPIEFTSDHRQYAYGYEDGSFQPEKAVSRAQVCVMLYASLASQAPGSLEGDPAGVTPGAWYYPAVHVLASRGVLDLNVPFRPEEPITRGELAELLSRMKATGTAEHSFRDLEPGTALWRAAAAAVERGWMSEESGAFHPDRTVTRAQAVAILNRFLNRHCDPVSAAQADSRFLFTDVSKDHWAYADILEATTSHWYGVNEDGSETWSRYWHHTEPLGEWETSEQVIAASAITNVVGFNYLGDYSYDYNLDYSDGLKEAFVNARDYSSQTEYLIWISRQNQKAYLFTGEQGNWRYDRTFVVATGSAYSPTPVSVSFTFSHAAGLYSDHYSCYPVTNFLAGTGIAFHSRLHAPLGREGWYDKTIGRPVSGGCIRMFDEDAQFIYDLPLMTTVVTY